MKPPVNKSMINLVYGAGARLTALLLPPRCLVCGEPGSAGRDLCAACALTLPWALDACHRCALPLPAGTGLQLLCGMCQQGPSPLQQVRATFLYAAPVDGLLRRFKFHQDLAAGRLLSQLMLARRDPPPATAALVPVPLHRSRLRQRGYDQGRELARPLARALHLPLCAALHRTRATAAQSELDATTRRRNVRGAFTVTAPLPAHVTLVDDVMTTGATLQAAASALRRAGVERVDAWVCARVP
jgi:ComF family protein